MSTANRGDVSKMEKNEKLIHEIERGQYLYVMSDPKGRAFVHRLLGEILGTFETNFHPSGSEMYFRSGKRNAGLQIFAEVETAAPDLCEKMRKEAKERNNG